MEDRLKQTTSLLQTMRPEDWHQIPDIDLYMDQIIAFMKRQHIGLAAEGDESLTPAMINNYIKSGLLPRAHGKRYDREHIGYLTAICLLKQVLSVKESGVLLGSVMQNESIEEFYRDYCGIVGETYTEVASKLEGTEQKEERAALALRLAVESYADMLACKALVASLNEEGE